MKYVTWIGAAALGALIAANYWTTPEPDRAEPGPAEATTASAHPFRVPPVPQRPFAPIDIIEPILVLPEWEVAPAPDLVLEAPKDRQPPPPITIAASPRPEAGRESRPWMEYAPEDAELSATRRLAWARLSTQGPAFVSLEASFEETAEPPLLEAKKR